jgi:hypothetical protein
MRTVNSRDIAHRADQSLADQSFMAFCGRVPSTLRRRWRPPHAVAAAAFLLVVTTLSGCGSDGVGALMVDPARYEGFNCKDLAGQWKNLITRENQLRSLINRADEGGGAGEVIGALTYRNDYQTVLEQKKVLQRTAAEKKCQMAPTPAATVPAFTSDQTIR